MKSLKALIYSFLAGVCISIGGAVFLSLENRVIGAALFTVGLFTIVTQGFYLFTGKVCYALEKDLRYLPELLLILLGNLLGCLFFGNLLRLTRVGDTLMEKAASLAALKLGDSLLSIFLLSLFCNILIYIAVEGFNQGAHQLGKYLSLFLGVMVFILCGFEHCVANMFYFTMAGAWSGRAALYMLVMVLGNAAGGLLFPLLRRLCGRERAIK